MFFLFGLLVLPFVGSEEEVLPAAAKQLMISAAAAPLPSCHLCSQPWPAPLSLQLLPEKGIHAGYARLLWTALALLSARREEAQLVSDAA